MNRTVAWIAMLLITIAGVPFAEATPVIYSFTGSPAFFGPGSLIYDSSTHRLSSFQLTWDGYSLDLTTSANAPTMTGSSCGTLDGPSSVALLSGKCVLDTVDWFAHVSPDPESEFTTFSSDSILVSANAGTPAPPYYRAGGTWKIFKSKKLAMGAIPEPSICLTGPVYSDWRLASEDELCDGLVVRLGP